MCERHRNEPTLIVAQMEVDSSKKTVDVFGMTGALQTKVFEFRDPIFVGDCMLEGGAKLIIRSDGTANWVARARSTDTNDTFSAYFLFTKQNNDPTFPTGIIFLPNRPFPVAQLNMSNSNTWYDWGSGFTFPADKFADMVNAAGVFSC